MIVDKGLSGFGEEVESDDLSSFSEQKAEKSVKSEASDTAVAAQGALLSENPEEIFQSYMDLAQSSDEERQAKMSQITDRLHRESVSFSNNLASQMLLDPDITEEQAQSFVQAMSGISQDKPSSADLLSAKMAALPSGDEDFTSEDIRIDAAEISRQVNARMQQKQALLNGHLLSTNKGGMYAAGDLLEQLAPLTDGLITAQLVYEVKGGSVGSALKAMALLGSAKTELKEYYMSLGSADQAAFEQALASALNEIRGIVFTNDNDLAQKDVFMSIVDGNYYGDFDKYFDNIVGVLDLIGVGALLRPVKLLNTASKISNVARRFMRSEVQPASPVRNVGEVNPEEARKLHTAAEMDETGEVVKATHGTTREEAIVDSEAPQVRTEDGSLENKVHNLARYIKEFIHSGNIDISDSEILSAQKRLVSRVQALAGVTNRTEMAQYRSPQLNPDGTAVFQNVYGPADSAYRTPQEGIDNVLFALRDYGVDESNLTILQKVGDEYVPTTVREIEAKKTIVKEATTGKVKPASAEELAEVERAFIETKKIELMADVSSRLSRGDRKQLLAEKRQLEEALARVVPEEVGSPVKAKNVGARAAKKEAKLTAARLTDEEKLLFKERLDLINGKLKTSKLGEEAEADLSRLEQGTIPTRFKSELDELKKSKGTVVEGTAKPRSRLPEDLQKENMQDNYLIQVNFEHEFDPTEIKWDRLQVKRNFFDRIPFFNRAVKGKSSVQRHLVDIYSMLDPRLTLGANVAVDKASAIETALIKHSEDFVNPFTSLSSDRQEALLEVIQNNNFRGELTSKKTLRANGYSEDEIGLLDRWQESWDQLYNLENLDLIKSLKAGGYQRFVDEANGTELVARKVGRNFLSKVRRVYDSEMGKTRIVSDAELDDLYANGGTIAKLRGPEKADGVEFEHVLVKNQQDKSMLRDLRESDRVLNYRKGYYTVRYKDPHIIFKKTVDKDGVERTQAVKTAGSKKDAELAVANYTRGETDASVSYGYRDNRDRTVGQMEDDAWSIHSASGRTSQKLRGERLGTTEPNVQGGALGAVEGPAEALLNSIRSISRRTSMRDYIERYKMRFMNDYEDLLKIDENSGQLKFPKDADDFKIGEASTNKRLADARTNLEYIHYLENGYRNGLDDTWKALLNGTADILGGSTKHGERFVRAVVEEIQSPTTWFKARAFDAYLALNPLRQFVVQGHQATLLAANFGKYVVSQKLARETAAIHLVMLLGDKLGEVKGIEKFLGMKADEAKALAEEYRKTGFDATIDRNNLVENGLDQIVDTERFKGAKRAYGAVVSANRKVGFDAGERINIMSAWLAHRNKALEQGKDITSKRVKDEIMAKARNYTFNMNAAGDMPYNKNSLALLFQFMQVPHKAMLQVTNRALSRTERAKLAAYNAIMLPMPVGIGHAIISDLGIEDENVRDFIANGLEGLILNKTFQLMSDDDTRVDFSSLAAVDPNAPYDLLASFLSSDIKEIMSNAPSLSLWAGYNPRATNILTETFKFITEPQDISVEESLSLMRTFANFSSGYANMSKSFRELYVQEYDRRYSSSGGITDSSITTPESIAKIFGFGSLQEAYSRQTKTSLYQASQEARDDVKTLYLAQKQLAAKNGVNVDNPEWQQHMLRAFWSVGDFSSGQQEEYLKLMASDARKGDDGVLGLILNNTNYVPVEEIEKAAHGAGVHDQLSETIQFIINTKRLGEEE